ncbi:MAG: hypothetical protein Q9207_002783 [Kuettlingeria erythrocarpa]
MDLASYEKVLDGARKYYGSREPGFAYRTKPTTVGNRKRIAPCESRSTGSRGTGEVVAVSGDVQKGSAQSKHRSKRKRIAPKDDETMTAVAIPVTKKSKARPNTLAKGIRDSNRGLAKDKRFQSLTWRMFHHLKLEGGEAPSASQAPRHILSVRNNIRVPPHSRSISTPFERRSRSSEIPAAFRRKRGHPEPNTEPNIDSDVADDMTLRTASATSTRPRSPSRRPTDDSGYHGSERTGVYEPAADAGMGFAALTSREAILKQRLSAFDKLHGARPLRVQELEDELETSVSIRRS